MKITKFSKPNVKQLRIDMEDALKAVEEKHGVKFDIGNASFNGTLCKFKTVANTINSNGEVETKEASAFRLMATQLGFKPDDLGRVLHIWNGKAYKIMGYNPRAPKWNMIMFDMQKKENARMQLDHVLGLIETQNLEDEYIKHQREKLQINA